MSAPPFDPYGVLGVPRTATDREITSAYRALLRAIHPDTRGPAIDLVGDAVEVLQRVLAAYALLSDPDRRATYDRSHFPRRQTVRTARPARIYPGRSPIDASPVYWTPVPTRRRTD